MTGESKRTRKVKMCWCDEADCPHGWTGVDYNLWEESDHSFGLSVDEEARVYEWGAVVP